MVLPSDKLSIQSWILPEMTKSSALEVHDLIDFYQ